MIEGILPYSDSLKVERLLNDIIDKMETLDLTIKNKILSGACLDLFEQVVEVGDKWHFVWEENYCE